MKSKCLLLFLLFLAGCIPNDQIQPPHYGQFIKSSVQEINDSTWENLSLWPKTIRKKNLEYILKIMGRSQFEKEPLNRNNSNYGARYELITEEKDYQNEDYHYGPFFVWRSDDSIRYKSVVDEKNNFISIEYYKNEIIARIIVYYSEIDLESVEYFSENNILIGYSIVQYANSPDRKIKKIYFWKDQFVSENDFNEKKCVFCQKLHTRP